MIDFAKFLFDSVDLEKHISQKLYVIHSSSVLFVTFENQFFSPKTINKTFSSLRMNYSGCIRRYIWVKSKQPKFELWDFRTHSEKTPKFITKSALSLDIISLLFSTNVLQVSKKNSSDTMKNQ